MAGFGVSLNGRIWVFTEDQRKRMNAGERIEGKIKTTARQIAENVEDGLRLVQGQRPPQTDPNQIER